MTTNNTDTIEITDFMRKIQKTCDFYNPQEKSFQMLSFAIEGSDLEVCITTQSGVLHTITNEHVYKHLQDAIKAIDMLIDCTGKERYRFHVYTLKHGESDWARAISIEEKMDGLLVNNLGFGVFFEWDTKEETEEMAKIFTTKHI